VIELNHAAAVSLVDGPARALALIDAIEARGALDGYDLLPAVRADLLRRLGRHEAARAAYLAASEATQLEPLRRLYARRLAELNR
jgi:RNA polymerase sigma-70 factor (ECF subfamily)